MTFKQSFPQVVENFVENSDKYKNIQKNKTDFNIKTDFAWYNSTFLKRV